MTVLPAAVAGAIDLLNEYGDALLRGEEPRYPHEAEQIVSAYQLRMIEQKETEKAMENIKQCWAANEEDFRHDSLGDLLDNNDELEVGSTVYVGEAEVPSYSLLCDASDVIEMMGERAYDIAGEYAEDFPDVTKEAEAELDALLQAWMQKHCAINFWTVRNVKPYVLTEDDFPSQNQEAA